MERLETLAAHRATAYDLAQKDLVALQTELHKSQQLALTLTSDNNRLCAELAAQQSAPVSVNLNPTLVARFTRWQKQLTAIEALREAEMPEAADAALATLLKSIKG